MAPTTEDDESARTSRALLQTAQTTTSDLYAILSLPNPSQSPDNLSPTPASLKKAWRTAALTWHPDKNIGKEELAADKLDEARKAFEILSDDAARAAYDGRQRAGREKKEREEKLEGRRRAMKEELEAAERNGFGGGLGVKRKAEAGGQETEAQKVARLGDEARRRVAEMNARKKTEREEAMKPHVTEKPKVEAEFAAGLRDGASGEKGTSQKAAVAGGDALQAQEEALMAKLREFQRKKEAKQAAQHGAAVKT